MSDITPEHVWPPTWLSTYQGGQIIQCLTLSRMKALTSFRPSLDWPQRNLVNVDITPEHVCATNFSPIALNQGTVVAVALSASINAMASTATTDYRPFSLRREWVVSRPRRYRREGGVSHGSKRRHACEVVARALPRIRIAYLRYRSRRSRSRQPYTVEWL